MNDGFPICGRVSTIEPISSPFTRIYVPRNPSSSCIPWVDVLRFADCGHSITYHHLHKSSCTSRPLRVPYSSSVHACCLNLILIRFFFCGRGDAFCWGVFFASTLFLFDVLALNALIGISSSLSLGGFSRLMIFSVFIFGSTLTVVFDAFCLVSVLLRILASGILSSSLSLEGLLRLIEVDFFTSVVLLMGSALIFWLASALARIFAIGILSSLSLSLW